MHKEGGHFLGQTNLCIFRHFPVQLGRRRTVYQNRLKLAHLKKLTFATQKYVFQAISF